MLPHHSSSTTVRNGPAAQFDIGDRVRLRLHPTWLGTVVARGLNAYSVDWDDHGVETTHCELLELVIASSEVERSRKTLQLG
jgi:hypothetical protein